jgi:hypothetical protein
MERIRCRIAVPDRISQRPDDAQRRPRHGDPKWLDLSHIVSPAETNRLARPGFGRVTMKRLDSTHPRGIMA